MNHKEQQRILVLNRVQRKELTGQEAATLLGLSLRQERRLMAAYRKEGVAAVAHGNRGRRPAHATPDWMRERIVGLAQRVYAGCNQQHLKELLEEREGVAISRSTVWRVLRAAGIRSPRHRRPPAHRIRRQRYPQEGMLLQIDGSDHDWLKGRGPKLTLLLAIDDATGTAPAALFRNEEDAVGYLLLFRTIAERKGIPLALYSDRHAVFCTRAGLEAPSQFGRAMRELGVAQVFALSPQAKGRIERANGTFQDRLVAELRLAGASTEAEANRVLQAFLPRFNGRFGVPPAQAGSAYRSVGPDVELEAVLCFKHQRKVAKDNTVKFRWRTLQLLPGMDRPTYAGVQVEVQERLDGSLALCHQGRMIPSQEAPLQPSALRNGHVTAWWESFSPLPCLAVEGSIPRVGARRRIPVNQTSADLEDPAKRAPTPKQQGRWDAVQEARRRGLGLRAIARETGISRNTVRKCLDAAGPMTYPIRRASIRTHEDVEFFSQVTV